MIILGFLWPSAMGLICSFTDLILGICWLSQNRVGRFQQTSFTLLCLTATLVPNRFALGCLGVFGNPIDCYFCKQAVPHCAIC